MYVDTHEREKHRLFDMKQYFGRWAKTTCDSCGDEFLVTRTEPKEIDGAVVCGECDMYMRGFKDGTAFAQQEYERGLRDGRVLANRESK